MKGILTKGHKGTEVEKFFASRYIGEATHRAREQQDLKHMPLLRAMGEVL